MRKISGRLPLAAFIVGLLLASTPTSAQSIKFLDHFKSGLPAGYEFSIVPSNGNMICQIKSPKILTEGASGTNLMVGQFENNVVIKFKITPRLSSEAIAQIKDHNRPINEKLKTLQYYSEEYWETSKKLIEIPQFQDEQFGYILMYPSWVPVKKSEKVKLAKYLKMVTKSFEHIDTKKQGFEELTMAIDTGG